MPKAASRPELLAAPWMHRFGNRTIVASILLVVVLSASSLADGDWAVETIDVGVRNGTDSSLALDGAGYAHISYLTISHADDDGSLMYAYEDGAGWHFETVDSSQDTGYDTTIALDSSGYPHITYRQYEPNKSLKYAYKDAGGWHTEVVKACTGIYADRAVTMVLDSHGQAHISFYRCSATGSWSLQHGHRGGAGWTFTPICDVDDVLGFNGDTAIAVDGSGTVYVAFMTGAGAYDLKLACQTAADWSIDTVDSASRVCRQLSLDVGPDGWPHIAYFDGSTITGEGNNDLLYAYRDASGWHSETVDAEGNTGWYSSIAVASDGYPHVSYFQHDLSQLKYASKDSSGWHVATADNSGYVGWHSSIKLDAANDPHVAYYEWHDAYALKYAVCPSGLWSTETVASGGAVGYYSSIAVEDDALPHISYYCGVHKDLKHAWQSSGAWHTEIVDGNDDVGKYTSIAMDRNQYPHISYYDVTNSSLKYAYEDGSGWHTSTIDNDGDVGSYTSIALDASGYPHISYCDTTHADLQYVYQDGSGWHPTAVDTDGSVGSYTSIALDTSGYPHISYYDSTHGSLKYAFKDSGGWHKETADNATTVGFDTSIALDASGAPHISYYDDSNHDLKYAHKKTEGWRIETVDAGPRVGQETSLAIDPRGRPHISYFAYEGGEETVYDLKHAYRDATQWHTDYVETGCDAGRYTSLALDHLGGRHISSYHLGHSCLKYAYAPPIAPPPTGATFRVDQVGNVLCDGRFAAGTFSVGHADIAEWVRVSEPVLPGEVMALAPGNTQLYRLSRTACSPLVAGVVSTEPGVVLGCTVTDYSSLTTYHPEALLALAGIVPVKVTNEGGPIQPGDLLVGSSTPGHAMRWAAPGSSPCALVGKALEPMSEEAGVILVLLTAH